MEIRLLFYYDVDCLLSVVYCTIGGEFLDYP
jgi:hypothetical protein